MLRAEIVLPGKSPRLVPVVAAVFPGGENFGHLFYLGKLFFWIPVDKWLRPWLSSSPLLSGLYPCNNKIFQGSGPIHRQTTFFVWFAPLNQNRRKMVACQLKRIAHKGWRNIIPTTPGPPCQGTQEGPGCLLSFYLKSPVYEYRVLRLKAGSDG